MVAYLWKSMAVSMLAALGGCAGMSEGPVPVSVGVAPDVDPDLSQIRHSLQNDCLDVAVISGTPDELRARRNNLVTAYMTAADIRYHAYERDLLAFSRQNDLGASLALQLLSAIGAASGSQNLARAMNITSGAVSGTQSAFAKSLLNQTVSVLQTHMRASREARYATIIEHLAMPYADWNTCLALREALAYEQAGTLNAALAAMSASATDEERSSNADAAQAVRAITYRTDTFAVAFATYLRAGANQRSTARAAITDLIGQGVIAPSGRTPAQILREFRAGDGTPEQRTALARRIVQREGGSDAGNALGAALPPR